jgi:FAD-linked oxidoreductase
MDSPARAHWRNWSGLAEATAQEVLTPATTPKVADAVRRARETGTTVKTAGTGHSFTTIAAPEHTLLRPDAMAGVVEVDRGAMTVTARAGTRLVDLNLALERLGLSLHNMGDIAEQTLAGAISTGTHGTGRTSAALATQVVALELVLADGSVLSCSGEENAEVFAAARVSLGALGIVTAVTLQAEPAFLLRADERPMPLLDVVDRFEEHVADNEHFELYWFPHTDIALTKRNNRTTAAAQPLTRLRALLEDEVISNGVFEATCRVGRAFPGTIPRINRAVAGAATPRTYIDTGPAVFTSKRRVRFQEMEYAVPRAELPALLRELRTLPERHGQRISFPVEVRVAPGDDVPLSTAFGRDTAYVAVHVFRGTDERPYFAAVEALMGTVGGRPHWGKMHSLGAEELRQRYPRFDEFVAVRDRLDPERRFTNAYLDRVLGP